MADTLETFITPEMDRRNGRIFLLSYWLIYLAAPVVYVGVVQAALCDRLGVNATIANLPATAYLLGQLAPLFTAWAIPHRLEKATVMLSTRLWAALVVMVFVTLVIPMPVWVRVAAVTAQGLLQGIAASVAQAFTFQCLGRGTTVAGRARALKWTFSFGPIVAVGSSLGAHYVLHTGFRWAPFPLDFALLYLFAACSIGAMAALNTRWRLMPLADEARQPFVGFLASSFRGYFCSRPLLLIFLAFFLLNYTQAATSTLSLHAKTAMQRDPAEVSGLIMMMRFGCKALGGYMLGVLAARVGFRASAAACVAFSGAGILWSAYASGYWYLFAFGLMGAGELAGAYFPAYVLSLSAASLGLRNQGILMLSVPAASFAPVMLGGLTDHFGFSTSLIFAFGASALALAFLAGAKTVQPVKGSVSE